MEKGGARCGGGGGGWLEDNRYYAKQISTRSQGQVLGDIPHFSFVSFFIFVSFIFPCSFSSFFLLYFFLSSFFLVALVLVFFPIACPFCSISFFSSQVFMLLIFMSLFLVFFCFSLLAVPVTVFTVAVLLLFFYSFPSHSCSRCSPPWSSLLSKKRWWFTNNGKLVPSKPPKDHSDHDKQKISNCSNKKKPMMLVRMLSLPLR